MNNNLVYRGTFSTVNNAHKPMLNYGAPTYTDEQNRLYDFLLVGRNAVSKQEWYNLNQKKKKKIVIRYKKAQKALNILKQEIMLGSVFIPCDSSNSDTLKIKNIFAKLTDGIKPDPNFICTLSFKQLGITKERRIELFLNLGLLPEDFATR